MKPYLLTFLLLSISITLSSQELKRKSVLKGRLQEEYFVLKNDKKIKQGQYVKSFLNVFDQKILVEYGYFDHNKKNGEWLEFYYYEPTNSLKAAGTYQDGLKQGLWRYYYPAKLHNKHNFLSMVGAERNTTIIEPEHKNDEKIIRFDSTLQVCLSNGRYEKGEKTGVWHYYFNNGSPYHIYNHSTDSLIKSYINDSNASSTIYLGGMAWFQQLYFLNLMKNIESVQINETSELICKMVDTEEGSTYAVVKSTGSPKYKEVVEKTLKELPDDWIFPKEDAPPLYLKFKLTIEPGQTRNNHLSFDYESGGQLL